MDKDTQSKKEYIEKQFENAVGYFPNIDNPKTFNEKIQWLKLYYRDPLMTQCADKYAVREYIKEKIGEEYLIPLLGVYNNANEIDFDKLPNKFVLKTNNCSGKNIICKNKSKLNIDEAKLKLKEWLEPNKNHYFHSYEWAYKNIKSKIICEKYIEQKNHKLSDYRFLCFFGKPEYIWLDTNSANENINHKRNVFDLKWNEINMEIGHPKNKSNNIKKPTNLAKMIALAKILSKDFPHVRVDFYNINGKIYFGELTFYSQNGMAKFKPEKWDYKMGKYLDINKINQEQTNKYLQYKKTRKTNIVIYTAISGNYEKLKQHKHISKDFDYVCFTDKKIKKPGIWEIRPLENIKQDLVRTAKYHKLFPNKILSEYRYSVWIDSNVDVLDSNLEKRIKELINKKEKIVVNIHPNRNCIYQEAKACIDLQKDSPEIILKEIFFLKKEKYPKNNGLFETNIIFREHNNPKIIKAMEDWWWMIENFSRRDQLSFNYVLWKNKLKCTSLFIKNARLMNNDFKFNDHNTKIVSTLSVDTGNGFNDDNFIQKIVCVSNNKYKVIFDLSEFKKIKQIKLSILKNNFCQFKINKIKINGKKISLLKTKYQTNGILIDNGFIDFLKTSDPQIIFNTITNIEKIKIYGKLNLYNLEYLYIESKKQIDSLSQEKEELQQNLNQINQDKEKLIQCLKNSNQENEKLQSDLNKIQSSKTYKIWQKFNKIKKILK